MNRNHRWRPWLTLAALLASGGTWASHVTPTTVAGNTPSCQTIDASLLGGSTNSSPVDGQAYPLGNGHTITFTYVPEGQDRIISFESTLPIDYVLVKGGDAYNRYFYPGGETEDDGLVSPDNSSGGPAGVSHVTYCFSPKPTGEKTAAATWKRFTEWEIDKSVTPENITMFDGDSHDVEYTVTATPTTTREIRVAGTITVKDPFDAGWVATNVNDTIQFNNDSTQFSRLWDAGANADTMTCTVPAPNADDIILSCSYEFILQSSANAFLLTAASGANSAAINLSRNGTTTMVLATANFTISSTPAASYGDTFEVDDSVLGGNPDHTFSLTNTDAWKYQRTFTCDADEGTKNNTATGTWTTPTGTDSDADSATVTVACEKVSIYKNATTSYQRDYAWTPQKYVILSAADAAGNASCQATPIATGTYAGYFRCEDAEITLNPGDTYETVYELIADQSQEDTTFGVTGDINVSWPSGLTPVFNPVKPTDILTFTDQANGTLAADVVCTPQGATTLSCSYSATLPRDFVPGYNTATIDRVKKCYAVNGTEKACSGTVTYTSNQANLVYGSPGAETNKCVSVSDLFNSTAGLNLGIGFDWIVNPNVCEDFSAFVTGDVDPGAGVKLLDILAAYLLPSQQGEGKSCQFMVPNLLRLGGDNGEDEAVVDVTVTQLCEVQGCTYTQGYWKTHVNYAAKPQFAKKRDATWDQIDGAGVLNENALFYSSGKTYIEVMWTAPAGNVYYVLAHQFIAAQLNVLDGASSATIAAELAQAAALFSQYGPTHSYWKNKTNKANATTLAGKLAAYNEGLTGPGHCSESPATLNSAR